MKPKSAKPQQCSDAGEEPLNPKPKNKPRVRKLKKVVAPGEVFGRLTVTVTGVSGQVVEASCSCGDTWAGLKSNLISGATSSCGCLQREKATLKATKHGQASQRRRTKLYMAWMAMRVRCYGSARQHQCYRNKGVSVCPEWQASFEAFATHLGPPPSPAHSVDRIDNNKGYQPGNVKWSTPVEQNNNRGDTLWLTAFGETRTVSNWSRLLGISRAVLYYRIEGCWTSEKTLTHPAQIRKPKSSNVRPQE